MLGLHLYAAAHPGANFCKHTMYPAILVCCVGLLQSGHHLDLQASVRYVTKLSAKLIGMFTPLSQEYNILYIMIAHTCV